MKKFIFSVVSFTLWLQISAQLVNEGATLIVESGANLKIYGNTFNTFGGIIEVNGMMDVQGHFFNEGTLLTQNGWLQFSGENTSQFQSGGEVIESVMIDKADPAFLEILDDLVIEQNLEFISGKLILGDNSLILGATATMTNAGSSRYIVTNGSGYFQKRAVDSHPFTFPVGHTHTSYHPVIIANHGVVEDFSIRVLNGVYENGINIGSMINEGVVGVSWEIVEANVGLQDENLSVTLQWNQMDELPGYNRFDAGIARYNGEYWDLTVDHIGMVSGNDPFTMTRSGLSTGVLAIGAEPLMDFVLLAPKVYLSGPYDTVNQRMKTHLTGFLPLNEPYEMMSDFEHKGRGGGEEVEEHSEDNVDWIFIELRDGNDISNVLGTCSAILKNKGDIVGTDENPVKLSGMRSGASYYLVIRHRNHLGIMTMTGFTSSRSTASALDFTDGSTPVMGNHSMRFLKNTFQLWPGDTNGDGSIKFAGIDNDVDGILNAILNHPSNNFNSRTFQFSGYSLMDTNLDGIIKFAGSENDIDGILNAVLNHPSNVFHSRTFTIPSSY
ncbi:MAG TPA: hypothetical protein PKC30_11965 [Saprospiraceae bacterium]|nr:hypothetical protein [Saprospiraceae bacterium]